MATIFATDETARIRIGRYGVATQTAGVQVPEAVADELAATYKHPGLLRIERDAAVASTPEPLDPEPEPEPEPAPAPKRRRQE